MKLYEKLLVGTAGTAGAGIAAWRTMFPWIGYDLQLMNVGRKLMAKRTEAMGSFLIDKFEKHVADQPKKPFIIFEDGVYTYEYVDQMACKVANMAKSWGLKALDVVAMMIQNEPSFVWTFLGLQKLGVTVAFINYNLKMNPLSHSILAAKPKLLIVGEGETLLEAVTEIREELGSMNVYVQGLGSRAPPLGIISFDPLFHQAHSSAVSPNLRSAVTMLDICCYIYTSGTTGNPKPAFITHVKAMGISCALLSAELTASDRVYISLPLYHSSGGGIGFFGSLVTGTPKPVMIHQYKVTGIIASLVSMGPSDVLMTVLPLYHISAFALGLASVVLEGRPKPVMIPQCKVTGMLAPVLSLGPSGIMMTVLPLYHSSAFALGLASVLLEGLPKPAYIKHQKVSLNCTVVQCVSLRPSDTFYIVLPIYHSAGGGTGLFGAIFEGATIVLRKRFSASHFWEDCCRYDVTVIQYIGELFRYLLAQQPSEFETSHSVRAAFGNGLRKDIWLDVEKRYKIPQIVEFFGATEGTTLLLNVANRPGAIGRLSPFLAKLDPDPKALVKFDFATAMPIRDNNGRCMKVAVGEPGLFISRVPNELVVNGKFEVYRSSKEANEKKLIRDAFAPGDMYFNYGDVFVQDKDYFVYFRDRIGDTFRWKGENVSTTELANVITMLEFINDANVYGVSVPGHDGRAGMVALTLNDGFKFGAKEIKELYEHIVEELPTYAQPLFIRVLDDAIITGTFKQRKVELVKEGFDLNQVKDPIFYLDREKKTYSPMSPSDLSKFLTSKL